MNYSLLLLFTLAACASGSEQSATAEQEAVTLDPRPLPVAEPITREDTLRDAKGALFVPTWTGVVSLDDRGVVAIDRAQLRIGRFDVDGKLQHVAGGSGGGPGEFRSPSAIFAMSGDSIAVWDPGLRRLSVFDSTLRFAHAVRLDLWNALGAYGAQLVGQLADGRWVGLVTKHEPMNPDAASGARASVDTVELIAGREGDAPTPLALVAVRPVVEVVLTHGASSTMRRLQIAEVSQGIGVVCERGVLLHDAEGLREIDARGAVTTFPPPRVGERIRTPRERDAMVRAALVGGLDSSSVANAARDLLGKHLRNVKARVLMANFDVDGRLWYVRRTPTQLVLDRVDRTGRVEVAVAVGSYAPTAHIGRTTMAMSLRGSDTTDNAAVMAKLPDRARTVEGGRLGRCAPPFQY